MRLKNWLLTGTSIGLLALLPVTVRAQDGDLVAAYQAYAAAQESGDAAALEAAQGTLTELCIVNGYASIEECIAAAQAMTAPAETTPAAEPEAETAAEPAAEEPAPAEAAAPEAAAEDATPAATEEAAPTEPAPAAEEVAEEPAEPAPAAQTDAPAEEASSEEMEPAADEPAATTAAEDPAADEAPSPAAETGGMEPVAEEPIPAAEEVTPVAEETPPEEATPAADEPVAGDDAAASEQAAPASVDISADLQAQIDIYNEAIASMMSGGDTAAAQEQIAQAQAQIDALCAEAGFADTATCLAEYGLSLPDVPNMAAEEATPAAAPADEATDPAADAAGEPTEPLDEGTTGEAAPLTDSGKEAQIVADPAATDDATTEPAADATAEPAAEATAEPAAEAEVVTTETLPESDAAAQSRIAAPDPATFEAISEEEGEPVDAAALAIVAADPVVPQSVTIIEQNNFTNNVTNNVTNNIGQQNNVTINEGDTIAPLAPGEAITQVILQVGTQLIVNSLGQDTDRFYDAQEDEIFYENLRNGRVRETITRPDGTQIITVRNRSGDVLRRVRITPDGREYVLAYFDEQYYDDLVEWRDPGQSLPPLRLNIPAREYVLDASFADEDEIETFFAQPPVEQVARLYSIDEVKRSARVRDSVRRLEIGGLTFNTGAATIDRDQVASLSEVANGMLTLLERNPGETFLIEGHTDAVGSEISNLRLSDLRAATVARILTDFYGIPPENLATQGYGERYLKVRTEAAERENRRVTIRRITPLITVASN